MPEFQLDGPVTIVEFTQVGWKAWRPMKAPSTTQMCSVSGQLSDGQDIRSSAVGP